MPFLIELAAEDVAAISRAGAGSVAEAWATEVLARSAAYSRGELQAVDWRAALQEIESDLNEMS